MVRMLSLHTGTSIGFSTENSRSHRTMTFFTRKALACAAVTEVEKRRRKKQEESLYEVLRVKRNASLREIKTAYRTLAKIYHPDAFVAAAEAAMEVVDGKEFIEIHEAYTTLSDPTARERYDWTLRLNSPARLDLMRDHEYNTRVGFHTTRRWETDQCW